METNSKKKSSSMKSSEALRTFSNAVERAKHELVTGLKLKQFDMIDSSKQEVTEYKQKLQQSKNLITELNKQILQLKNEKRARDQKLEIIENSIQKVLDDVKLKCNHHNNNNNHNGNNSEGKDDVLDFVKNKMVEIVNIFSQQDQQNSSSTIPSKTGNGSANVKVEDQMGAEEGNQIYMTTDLEGDDGSESEVSDDDNNNMEEQPRTQVIERFIKIVPYKIKIERVSPDREMNRQQELTFTRFYDEEDEEEEEMQPHDMQVNVHFSHDAIPGTSSFQEESLQYHRGIKRPYDYGQETLHEVDEDEMQRYKVQKINYQDSDIITFPESESSILRVPEMYRINYGFSDNWELDMCPISKQFWYDPLNSHKLKMLVRFYNDNGNLNSKRLVLKVQTGLMEPKTFHINILGITEKLLEKTRQPKRIWVDVRDFNIFGGKGSIDKRIFSSIGNSVTHFSFGKRLYSFDELQANTFIHFICKYLPNLEYLAVNDWMLRNLDSTIPLRKGCNLPKLKVIRFSSSKFRISTIFIDKLMSVAPNLEAVYGIPLHSIREMKTLNPRPNLDTIRSIFPVRFRYSRDEEAVNIFYEDLSSLSRLNPTLEEIDARLFFIPRHYYKTRQLCIERFGRIIRWNQRELKRLVVEIVREGEHIELPILQNLVTLQFDITVSRQFHGSFFPEGFDLNCVFPLLREVDLYLDEKNAGIITSLTKRKGQELFDKLFPTDVFRPGHVFLGVNKLVLQNYMPKDCMSSLRNLFPYVTVLTLSQNLVEFTYILPHIFALWPQLRVLTLHMSFSMLNRNLDSAFTGIPTHKCKMLRRELDEIPVNTSPMLVQKNILKHRDKVPISHLKDLILLKIVLRNMGWTKDNSSEDCIMSPVSAIYGFSECAESMENLKVLVSFDERCSSLEIDDMLLLLEPVRPYVYVDW